MGWVRPGLAVGLGLLVPALLSMLISDVERPALSGLPKDGSGFTVGNHCVCRPLSLFSGVLAGFTDCVASIALQRDFWLGSAVLSALIVGLPIVHFALNRDVTIEDPLILPHIAIAIALLSLAVRGFFVGLMALREKCPNIASKK